MRQPSVEFQADAIDRVIKNTIEVMESSKYQIFEILQVARDELAALTRELKRVMEETEETLKKVDKLELDYHRSRIRLTEVSRDFVRYTEKDIRIAYEKATELQLELMMTREREAYLRSRRDELQMRVRSVENSVERAESIGSQMSVVVEYLSGELGQVTRIVESAKNIAMRKAKNLWCNARFLAIGFYERQDWIQSGELFEVPILGPHIVMKWMRSSGNIA